MEKEKENNGSLKDVSKLDELGKESIIETPETIKGVIVSRKIAKAKEIYGDNTYGKPNKEYVVINIENNKHNIKISENYAYYKNPNVRSNLGKFLKRYGRIEVGQEVVLTTNDDGFYEVELKI